MALTSRDIALQMIQQLRVLDPAISAEAGTPERKIIDTLAIKIAEGQLDLTALQGGLDIDTKFGSNLDSFLKLFNFGRQSATRATGFVTFSRGTSPAPLDIRIPANTRAICSDPTGDIPFRTTFDVVLKAGQTTVVAPIECIIAGTLGNLAANRITTLTGVDGIYSVTNELPTSGGLDQEDDDALKVRFKNTVFRNVSGTYDQYLALAVGTPFTTKATVIGPISRYREYVQVPDVDDATVDPSNGFGGNDVSGAGHYTTALSSIPYSKWVYSNVPHFVSNGKLGAEAVFYRSDTDYLLNTASADKNKGDAYRESQEHPGDSYYDPTANQYRPNVTFLNVYTGTVASVEGVRPGDVLLFEHSYMSSASRNDWSRNITNAVDVFIDGGNDVVADCIVPQPTSANLFVDDPTHRYYFENYRRSGEAEHRPVIGNVFTPLFFQPVTSLPDTITVNSVNYFLGYHYWLVEDVSELSGTVRARNGIEWNKYLPGQQTGESATDPSAWSGPTIVYGDDAIETASVAPPIEVASYTYDKNINDLQASYDSNKQVTTDPLAHKAAKRYIKLDLTVMYTPGVAVSEVNNDIRDAVSTFLSGQYFGATVQLADLLKVVHSLSSVDNVRWSRDVPTTLDEIDQRRNRVIAVNQDGSPRLNVVVDRIVTGSSSAGRYEQLSIYVTGSPTGGTFVLYRPSSPSTQTASIAYNASAATVQSELRTLTGDVSLTVSGSGTAANPWIVNYSATGYKPDITMYSSALTGGPTILNTDFYLEDNELPALPDDVQSGDTVAGLILRPRAQNTWVRGNV